MKKKITVGIIFGGKSAEHEISIRSAKNVYDSLDRTKYEPILIGITKTGRWLFQQKTVELPKQEPSHTALVPCEEDIHALDVVFPVLHGPYGEDGTMQGLLKLMNIPFVGPGVLGSAVGMDKDVMKRLLRDAGIAIAPFTTAINGVIPPYAHISKRLGRVLYIKPANLGSSVGVSKVTSEREYLHGMEAAFRYDRKVIIEQEVAGREIEVSILGNEDLIASLPGEIIPTDTFYSYDEKYSDISKTRLVIPAQLPKKLVRKIQHVALQTFSALCCEGMARVDVFLTDTDDVIVNEINTIPGFTSMSMYPKLWEASGITYSELIDRLIQLALERSQKEHKLLTSR